MRPKNKIPAVFIVLILGELLYGWGYEVHRRINRAATDLVPDPLGKFLVYYQDTLAAYAPDPDYWKSNDPDEGYRHYIDADYYDQYPFDAIPRSLDSLIIIYGDTNVADWGIGPWVVEDYCRRITGLLADNNWDQAILAMAAMGHYIADLHMPLHVVANYNGQLTGNDGVHFRWEARIVDELVTVFDPVGQVSPVSDPLELAFDIVKESYRIHSRILSADSLARATLDSIQIEQLSSYDKLPFEDGYLRILFNESQDVVYDRLGRATVRIAAYWYSCWIKAGSPAVPQP